MEFGLLGPLLIRRDGQPVEVGAPKQRALLIHLLLRVGQTVAVDRLIDALWEEDPPPQARVTLRSYVSSLRRTLDDPDGGPIIITSGNGYGLQAAPESVDAVRFERLVQGARQALAEGDPRTALAGLEEGLALWRGEALADVADSVFARGEHSRLEELRLSAEEDRFDALLALGRHGDAVPLLEAFTSAEPLRERARAQLMLGLYRSNRAPDALEAFKRFRETLVDELGLDPSPQLQGLADRILNQAADLDPPTSAATASATPHGPRESPMTISTMVGRVHERDELRAGVDRLLGGGGDLLLVAGEPGIGKTTLLEELGRLASSAGAAVHWGRCHQAKGAPAFWPWTQVLRGIAAERSDEELRVLTDGTAGAVVQLAAEIGQRLDQPPPALGDDLEAARFQLYDAIATFLARAGAQRPLVVLLDDLHWADAPSLQALAFLTPLLGSGNLLVAGSYRDVRADWAAELEATLATVVREPSTRQLGLSGLQPSAVAQLAQGMTTKVLSAEELELLHRRTAGNPFFVRQLAQLLDETDSEGRPLAVPTGVRHVIARRLSMLRPEVRDVLEAAAVIGGHFDVRHLAAAAGATADDTLAALGDAAAHGLIEAPGRPETTYRFVHALVRETIYGSLAPQRTARLHAQVASAMEHMPQTSPAELAEHFWHAADLVDDDRPIRYLVAAAEQSLAVAAHEEAEAHLRRALALSRRAGDPTAELGIRVRLLQLMISIHGWAADIVEEIAGPALELTRAAGLRAGMVPFWVALLSAYTAHGDHTTARVLAEELLEQATAAGEPGALAAGHTALAYVNLIIGGEPAAALEHLSEAEHYADVAPAEALQAIPHIGVAAIYMQAVALAHQGEKDGALETSRRSIALADQVADPLSKAIAYMIAALVGVLVEHPAFAADMAKAGLLLCERHGFQYVGHLITASDSWARARLGEDGLEHAGRMREATEAIARLGHSDPRAKYILFAAETYLLAGDPTSARELLDEARALSERTGEFLPTPRLQQIEAELMHRRPTLEGSTSGSD